MRWIHQWPCFLIGALGISLLVWLSNAQPIPVRFAWDPPQDMTGVVGYHLWNSNQLVTTTNTSGVLTGFMLGPVHLVSAASVNASGFESATAATTTVRVIRFSLERSDRVTGPWSAATNWLYVISPVLTNEFFRMRLDWQ